MPQGFGVKPKARGEGCSLGGDCRFVPPSQPGWRGGCGAVARAAAVKAPGIGVASVSTRLIDTSTKWRTASGPGHTACLSNPNSFPRRPHSKRGSGAPSMTWEEAVDTALCFGWIDGIRKGAGEVRYVIRFTPRNPRSTWSVRNIARVRDLAKRGLMEAAGLAAYGRLKSERSAVYSYEQRRRARLSP